MANVIKGGLVGPTGAELGIQQGAQSLQGAQVMAEIINKQQQLKEMQRQFNTATQQKLIQDYVASTSSKSIQQAANEVPDLFKSYFANAGLNPDSTEQMLKAAQGGDYNADAQYNYYFAHLFPGSVELKDPKEFQNKGEGGKVNVSDTGTPATTPQQSAGAVQAAATQYGIGAGAGAQGNTGVAAPPVSSNKQNNQNGVTNLQTSSPSGAMFVDPYTGTLQGSPRAPATPVAQPTPASGDANLPPTFQGVDAVSGAAPIAGNGQQQQTSPSISSDPSQWDGATWLEYRKYIASQGGQVSINSNPYMPLTQGENANYLQGFMKAKAGSSQQAGSSGGTASGMQVGPTGTSPVDIVAASKDAMIKNGLSAPAADKKSTMIGNGMKVIQDESATDSQRMRAANDIISGVNSFSPPRNYAQFKQFEKDPQYADKIREMLGTMTGTPEGIAGMMYSSTDPRFAYGAEGLLRYSQGIAAAKDPQAIALANKKADADYLKATAEYNKALADAKTSGNAEALKNMDLDIKKLDLKRAEVAKAEAEAKLSAADDPTKKRADMIMAAARAAKAGSPEQLALLNEYNKTLGINMTFKASDPGLIGKITTFFGGGGGTQVETSGGGVVGPGAGNVKAGGNQQVPTPSGGGLTQGATGYIQSQGR